MHYKVLKYSYTQASGAITLKDGSQYLQMYQITVEDTAALNSATSVAAASQPGPPQNHSESGRAVLANSPNAPHLQYVQ